MPKVLDWIEGGVIPLYVWLISHSCEISPVSLHRIFPASGIRADGLGSDRLLS